MKGNNMEETLTAIDINCTTGEVTERPLTIEEISDLQLIAEQSSARKAEEDAIALAKAEAKASAEAKLTALGLTPEEIAALR
jgi:hypothetical protein